MTPQDAELIVAIAALAAQADGKQDDAERQRIAEMAAGLGLSDSSALLAGDMAAKVGTHAALARITEQLSSPEARQTAYDTAVSVCYADGWVNPNEVAFLRSLATALRIEASGIDQAAANVQQQVAGSTAAPAASATSASAGDSVPSASASGAAMSGGSESSALDTFILDQAMLSAALELLPDRLANLGILPLQLRLVQQIGERHGQTLNASQVKDLVAVFGIGAAAQIMEKVVRNTFGGMAGMLGRGVLGGMLGGIAGGAAGLAAGASVTFATTYALGHASEQYYSQDRSLSTTDLQALFQRFRRDATTLYPRVEARIRELASSGEVGTLLRPAPR